MDRAADIAALSENVERKDRKEQERKTESLTYMGVWDTKDKESSFEGDTM